MTEELGVLARVRRSHEERVVNVLRESGPMSRARLVSVTGLSRATLFKITSDLLDRSVLTAVRQQPAPGRRGRPAGLLALHPKAGQAVGVDIGHQRVQVAVANAAHEVVGSRSARCDPRASWASQVAAALALVDDLASDTGMRLTTVQGVGVGIWGPVSFSDASGKGRGAKRIDTVRAAFKGRFDAPVLVDNNTRFAALAEAIWGRSADADDVLYIRLSGGVGGGLVLGGRLYRGAAGVAGEFGHVTVDPDGPRCACGGRGCLETYASVPAVLSACERALGTPVTLEEAVAEASAGRTPVLEVVERVGTYLGRVVAASCTTLNPAQVVIGGELTAFGTALFGPVRRVLREEAHSTARRSLRVRAGRLGDGAGALGAIAAIFHESPLLVGYPTLTNVAVGNLDGETTSEQSGEAASAE